MNLHAMANTAISTINANEIITLYQADGQENMRGLVTTKYLAPQKVVAQVQCEGNASLQVMGNTGQSSIQKRFYLNDDTKLKPQSLLRQKDRSGDIIELADGTFWLVTAMPADYAHSGWLCLIASLQTMPPDFSQQDWFYEEALPEEALPEDDLPEEALNVMQDMENTEEKGGDAYATEIQTDA